MKKKEVYQLGGKQRLFVGRSVLLVMKNSEGFSYSECILLSSSFSFFFSFRFDVDHSPRFVSADDAPAPARRKKGKARNGEERVTPGRDGSGTLSGPARPGPVRSRHPMGTPRYTYGWFYASFFGLLFFFFFSFRAKISFGHFLVFLFFFVFFLLALISLFCGIFLSPSHFDIFESPPFYLA